MPDLYKSLDLYVNTKVKIRVVSVYTFAYVYILQAVQIVCFEVTNSAMPHIYHTDMYIYSQHIWVCVNKHTYRHKYVIFYIHTHSFEQPHATDLIRAILLFNPPYTFVSNFIRRFLFAPLVPSSPDF